MNKQELNTLTDTIIDLYITLKIRPQDEVKTFLSCLQFACVILVEWDLRVGFGGREEKIA